MEKEEKNNGKEINRETFKMIEYFINILDLYYSVLYYIIV